jgi:hypothetical protein
MFIVYVRVIIVHSLTYNVFACSEGSPKWTAYCAYNVYLDTPSPLSRQHRRDTEPVALNVLLASNTSLLYSWHVCVGDLLEPSRDRSNALRSGGEVVPPSHLVGVVELPLKVTLPPRLLLVLLLARRSLVHPM